MADLTEVYTALQKADAAGDTVGAKQLADYIRSQGTAPQAEPAPNPATDYGGNTLQLGPLDTHIPIGQGGQNFLAGAGKAFVDLGRGVSQWGAGIADAIAPRSPSLDDLVTGAPLSRVDELRQQVAQSRQRDAPLMASTAGKVGNISGNVAATLPAMAIPGANTVVGAGLIGAATGALQPSTSTGETVRSIGVGGVLGAGGQAVSNAVAAGAQRILAGRAQTAANLTSQNAQRDAVLQAGRAEGYVVPPTEVNPSATATALESISGKAATKQAAQAQNQTVTNRLVAQDLGLPANQPITQQALAGVRQQAGQVYRQVGQAGRIMPDAQFIQDIRSIQNVSQNVQAGFPGAVTPAGDRIDALVTSLDQPGFSSAQALEYTKRLRQQAAANFTVAGRSGDPEARALAQAQIRGADSLEDMIGRHLQANGQPDLLQAFQEARTTIAKSYQAQAALKGGNVSATRLAAQLQKGRPMTDGFGLVARFADHFGDATKLPKGGVGVSKLAAAVGGSGMVGGLLTGNIPLAAAAAAGTAAPYAVRQGLLSGVGQRALATPDYTPSLLGTAALQSLRQAPNAVLPTTAATLPLIQPGQ